MTTAGTLALAGSRGRRPMLLQALRLALRELRNGLQGFYVFIGCIALGVMVITGVGALADALRAGFESQGRRILGGDVTVARVHKRADEAELRWLRQNTARLSETATMRAMARRLDGQDQILVELKAVDGAYPLVGAFKLAGGGSLDQAVRQSGGAAVDPIVLERLSLQLGDRISIGTAEVPITAVIEQEPDTLSERLTAGPRFLVSLETLERTGLVQPGSLVRWRYALTLPEGLEAGAQELASFRQTLKTALPEAGFTVADRRDPSPQVSRALERLRQFLTLIGLTALLVGGVGVANAVATFIDRRRNVIATFKSLGATSGTIFVLFLTQVMLVAALGIAIGIALGYLLPVVLNALYGSNLPIRAEISLGVWSTLSAAAYGLLVALVFTLWPLGRAELIRPGVLFRDEVAPEHVWPRLRVILMTAAAAGALTGLAVLAADARRIAIYFCLGVTVVFALFVILAALITWTARRLPRPRRPELALAVTNLGAPGGLTRSVVVSLGAGLSLLVAVALCDAALVHELSGRLPKESPAYFVLDIPKEAVGEFRDLVSREVPGAKVEDAPMLRGRLVALKGTPSEEIRAAPEAQWVLNGDRGLTYSETLPEGSKLVAGQWWESDYSGEPLVSFERELANGLGLRIGDTVTVNVLGRNISARIANLRDVHWESLGINFVMVFSPNTLRAAPHNLLATIALPPAAGLEAEVRLARALARAFPSATPIRVKDALDSFNAVLGKVMTAVRVAGSVTLVAGALVLAGALATAQRRRIQQAVILKAIGATRSRILSSHVAEYLILASVTAMLSVVLGTFAAWVVLTQVMELEFIFTPAAVILALALATTLVLTFGGLGTRQVLKAPAAAYLRSE
jgi:putative ABC transport system permease protein